MKNATDFINLVFCGCKDSAEPNEQKKLKTKEEKYERFRHELDAEN
jgi:hypothetical protein